jgi:hypothetical protein
MVMEDVGLARCLPEECMGDEEERLGDSEPEEIERDGVYICRRAS